MKNLKDRRRLQLIIVLLTIAVNYWIWRIIFLDPLLAIILSLLTLFLYLIFLNINLTLWIGVLLFVFASFLNLKSGLDVNLRSDNRGEIKLNERHFYYSEYLGKLYENKVSTYIYNLLPTLYKFEKNVFSSLDLNLYFFASHPRERVGIEEFKKYPYLFTPFFLIGYVFLIIKKTKIVLIYLVTAALINGFISPNYKLGPVLFFPLINMFIAFGIVIAFSKVAKFLKLQI